MNTMKKLEYKMINLDVGVLRPNISKNEEVLNELGQEGWELVATSLGQKLIFKRELK